MCYNYKVKSITYDNINALQVNSKRSTTVCGGKQFIQEYSVEDGDSLEVRVLGPMSKTDGQSAHFLLQYTGITDKNLILIHSNISIINCVSSRSLLI